MDAAVKRRELRWSIPGQPRVKVHYDASIGLESKILMLEIAQSGGEESRGGKQNKRERGLEHNKHFPRKRAGARSGAAGAAESFDGIHARGHPRGSDAKGNSSD